MVWVLGQDGKPQSKRIKVGLNDGASTEVVEGNLNEGDMVITGQTISGVEDCSTTHNIDRQALVMRRAEETPAVGRSEKSARFDDNCGRL